MTAASTANPTEAIRRKLADVYTADGVDLWLNGRKASLGGRRPIDLIAAGEHDRVLAAVEALGEGMGT